MMKNVSYALPLLGKFSRVDAMSHWYKATEICRRKKKRQQNILFLFILFFSGNKPTHSCKFFTEKKKKTQKRDTNMVTNKATPIKNYLVKRKYMKGLVFQTDRK